ncbi:PDZ domain-containing protein 2 [Heterocephalus glaber]|uniref:PDZ domain-containing protein 2 n=1 Tax=Heterocephalus glaber TaxID=10181 RepID=G5BTB1_HETGA|nr:PDZ domain-containing protein 2 [Heterocephalus glaber]
MTEHSGRGGGGEAEGNDFQLGHRCQALNLLLTSRRKVGCYDANDASDEEEFEGQRVCISLPGAHPGPGRPLSEDGTRHVSVTVEGNKHEEPPQKTLGVMSTESPTSSQQKSEDLVSRHKPVAKVTPHCRRPTAEAGLSSPKTAALTGRANDHVQP